MDAVPGDRPRCLAAHQPTPICAVRPSGRDDGTRHHPRARSMGARPAECINWVERYRFGLADDALRCACPLAAFCLGTVGHNGRWPVAVIRPACLLDSQCRSLHEQHDHRSACNNLLSSRADDAWHEPRRHDGREHSPSRMDILALLVAAAPANYWARLSWFPHRPLSHGLSARTDWRDMAVSFRVDISVLISVFSFYADARNRGITLARMVRAFDVREAS